jgi:hypothetical protein
MARVHRGSRWRCGVADGGAGAIRGVAANASPMTFALHTALPILVAFELLVEGKGHAANPQPLTDGCLGTRSRSRILQE